MRRPRAPKARHSKSAVSGEDSLPDVPPELVVGGVISGPMPVAPASDWNGVAVAPAIDWKGVALSVATALGDATGVGDAVIVRVGLGVARGSLIAQSMPKQASGAMSFQPPWSSWNVPVPALALAMKAESGSTSVP